MNQGEERATASARSMDRKGRLLGKWKGSAIRGQWWYCAYRHLAIVVAKLGPINISYENAIPSKSPRYLIRSIVAWGKLPEAEEIAMTYSCKEDHKSCGWVCEAFSFSGHSIPDSIWEQNPQCDSQCGSRTCTTTQRTRIGSLVTSPPPHRIRGAVPSSAYTSPFAHRVFRSVDWSPPLSLHSPTSVWSPSNCLA